MNKLILMGRLARDPEVRYTQGEKATAVANFSLAVDRRFKREGEPTADFFNCTAFGKTAETIEKYLRKGSKILVDAELRTDNYTNKEGQKVYAVRVYVNSFEFCESKGSAAPAEQPAPTPAAPANEGFMDIPEGLVEELPFS